MWQIWLAKIPFPGLAEDERCFDDFYKKMVSTKKTATSNLSAEDIEKEIYAAMAVFNNKKLEENK